MTGELRTFHVAVCDLCRMELPFYDRAERDAWAAEHGRGTLHVELHGRQPIITTFTTQRRVDDG